MSNSVTAPGGDAARFPEPLLLAIETAGSRCSAAVARGERVLAADSRPLGHGHGETLLPMVDRVLADAGLPAAALDIVAATVGPGGFTGIRVGLAAARGIALAIGARLIGVTGFDAVMHAFSQHSPLPGASLLVALDSRRADLYVQLFALPDATPVALPQAVLPDRLSGYIVRSAASAPLLVAGDAALAAACALHGCVEFDIVPDSPPDALGVVAAALAQLRYDATGEPASGAVRPLYLRPPDVTLPKSRGPAPPSRP